MELFADSILPDLGLKRVEPQRVKSLRLKREEEARAATEAARLRADREQRDAAERAAVESDRNAGLLGMSNLQLVSIEARLKAKQRTAAEDQLLTAVTRTLDRPGSLDVAELRDRVASGALRPLRVSVATTFGVPFVSAPAPRPPALFDEPTANLATSAPKKAGGGIPVVQPLVNVAVDAVLGAILNIDGFFAANPADP